MNWLVSEIGKPLIRRVGTAFGAYLLTIGVQGDTQVQIVAGLTASLSVALDLLLSHRNRKK